MQKAFTTMAMAFVRLVMAVIMALLVGFLAWGCRQFYESEKLSRRFTEESRPVVVQVTTADRQGRAWYDQFTDPVYITFSHLGHSYTVRYVQDTSWLASGDRVTLLYHAKLNAFRQPGIHYSPDCTNLLVALIIWLPVAFFTWKYLFMRKEVTSQYSE